MAWPTVWPKFKDSALARSVALVFRDNFRLNLMLRLMSLL
jgi:hypothetical protein